MTRARVALLGAGRAGGALHLPLMVQLADLFEVAAVVDPDLPRAQALASRHGGVPAVCELAEVVGRVDGVVVATPWHAHTTGVLQALARGAAVLCEKPLTLRPSELDLLSAAHAEPDRVVSVGCHKRFDAALRQLAAAVPASRARQVLLTVHDPNAPDLLDHLSIPAPRLAGPEPPDEDLGDVLGEDAPPSTRFAYRHTVGGSLIHWIDWVGGYLDDVDLSLSGHLHAACLTDDGRAVTAVWQPSSQMEVLMTYRRVPPHVPYSEQLQVLSDDAVHRARLPAPYDRDAPSVYSKEVARAAGTDRTVRSSAPGERSFLLQLRTWHARLAGHATTGPSDLRRAARDLRVALELVLSAR